MKIIQLAGKAIPVWLLITLALSGTAAAATFIYKISTITQITAETPTITAVLENEGQSVYVPDNGAVFLSYQVTNNSGSAGNMKVSHNADITKVNLYICDNNKYGVPGGTFSAPTGTSQWYIKIEDVSLAAGGSVGPIQIELWDA